MGWLWAIWIILLTICFIGYYEDEKAWEAFKIQHHCKVVGKTDGRNNPGVGVGVGANGSTTVVMTNSYTPPQDGWLCDDGITYWKNSND